MTTKLVYVLTCAPDATFIEQALMAIFSARYWNPDAHIVLIVDDLTDKLLVNKRGEILDYISEKIVVPFDADKSAHYRSRWLKTSVRELIKGNYLFIDCDTIVTRNISSIEQIDADIAMVCDENISIVEEIFSALRPTIENCSKVGVDISKEKYYFNSGVMYVRDTRLTHQLYRKWHEFWLEGVAQGINVDQPTFAKANIACGRPVVLIENRWNAIVKSEIEDIYSAYILHFWHSVSFLYFEKCLQYIRENGLTDFIRYYVLHPTETFLPSDSHISLYKCQNYIHLYHVLRRVLRAYGTTIDPSFDSFAIGMRTQTLILCALHHHMYSIAALIVVVSKWYRVSVSGKFVYKTNKYSK